MNKIFKSAFINVSLTFLYIVAVAAFMYYAGENKIGQVKTIAAPIALLLLFVFSAAFTGYFIFGRPAIMFLDGKKKEAIALLTYTFILFFAVTLIALISLIALGK
ncbi:MAG: hypothetical protein WC775_04435 [Patescibacteria group bacterium]